MNDATMSGSLFAAAQFRPLFDDAAAAAAVAAPDASAFIVPTVDAAPVVEGLPNEVAVDSRPVAVTVQPAAILAAGQ
jgi:hypothetical protein